MDLEVLKEGLKAHMGQFRFSHTLGCADTCRALAEKLGYDPDKAYLTGLLHDCAKDMPFEKQIAYARQYGYEIDDVTLNTLHILHAPVGAIVAREVYGINDEDILSAIACHTTGKENMSLLDKILFTADLTEPNRTFPAAEELRKKVDENFDDGLIAVFDRVIGFVIERGGLLHPTTVYARNYLIKEKMNVS